MLGSDGHEIRNIIDASSAAVIFVIDFKGGGKEFWAGHTGSAEGLNICFLNPFANTDVHDV